MNRDHVIDLLQMNYREIKEGKGRGFDKRVAYTIAQSYTAKAHHFSDYDYRRMEEILKAELSVFNLLRQPVRGLLLGMMLANNKSKELDIQTLLLDYQRLCDVGFQRSSYSYFSAYLLLFTKTAEKEFIVRKARSIFEELKSHHYFLTGAKDGAISITLAQQEKLESLTSKQIAYLVEEYYQILNKNGFYKSSELQFAAATAAMLTGYFSHELIEVIIRLIVDLKQIGIKFKKSLYNNVVTLAFLATIKEIDFQALRGYLECLEKKTNLRFYKEFRQSLALSLMIQEEMNYLMKDDNLNMSALTITMIMAQEASAAAAAIAVSMAAVNSSS
ncbi:DUF4003 family protein [Enterococcus caccae]|uniref:DUF4003 domain-containing protein n=1 Tax=Enterococcus caccae ATCC BAA-1240 TaxID=1158612 RepID=R3TS70_9ENTE|nr:DUF4003 family protein [Enterococcus caccae]EOL44409.1 hypothetical protein UC7_02453 [Enterococcus caccae ATCC BAA-1240]EOT68475.1 hypothetical protein I580_00858 [Enterococcus caccae ATCC BAA-1240]